MESEKIDLDFAKAWDNNQGDFSKNLAENIMQYSRDNKKTIKSALDICCGTSNFLSVLLSSGINCAGTEIDQSMIDYSKEKYSDIEYFLSQNVYDINTKGKYDLITCNHDMINYLETFDEWKLLFKNVSKHLDGKGIFMFDFYTKSKLKDWSETSFTSSHWLDCLMNVKSGIYDKTVINYTYYINYQDYMVKTKNIVVESCYESSEIINALKGAGFKTILTVDSNFMPITNIDDAERVHVLAMKK